MLGDLKVTDIQRLHPPTPVTSRSIAQAAPMASTFRLTFASATAVEKAVDRLEAVDGVEFAEPNRCRESYAIRRTTRTSRRSGG